MHERARESVTVRSAKRFKSDYCRGQGDQYTVVVKALFIFKMIPFYGTSREWDQIWVYAYHHMDVTHDSATNAIWLDTQRGQRIS